MFGPNQEWRIVSSDGMEVSGTCVDAFYCDAGYLVSQDEDYSGFQFIGGYDGPEPEFCQGHDYVILANGYIVLVSDIVLAERIMEDV